MQHNKYIVAFDFDGTITTKDTFKEFIKHCFGTTKMYLGFFLLSPVLLLYKIGLLRNDIAKEITFSYFFKDMSIEKFSGYGSSFKKKVDEIVRSEALEKILEHRSKGHYLTIVSASMEDWIKPWAIEHHFNDVIATKIEVVDGKLTGKFNTKNCYGIQKVVRLQEKIPDLNSKFIYAYGDSKGDRELLSLANKSSFKNFDVQI